jgi:hypothetical protein
MKERLTLNQVIDLANKHYGVDPKKTKRNAYKKSYIYNQVFKKKLTNHGPRHMALFDEDEVRKVLRLY